MKNHQLVGLLMVGLLMNPGLVKAEEATSPYTEIAAHYEAIRLVLLADSVEDVAEHAEAIEDLAKGQLEDFDSASSAVPEEDAATFKTALQEIQSASSDLSAAGDLDTAREVYFSLTKPLARYRKLSGDQASIVAYCPMAQKAWIQPEGELGNPYMGQQMPKCGEVVGE